MVGQLGRRTVSKIESSQNDFCEPLLRFSGFVAVIFDDLGSQNRSSEGNFRIFSKSAVGFVRGGALESDLGASPWITHAPGQVSGSFLDSPNRPTIKPGGPKVAPVAFFKRFL